MIAYFVPRSWCRRDHVISWVAVSQAVRSSVQGLILYLTAYGLKRVTMNRRLLRALTVGAQHLLFCKEVIHLYGANPHSIPPGTPGNILSAGFDCIP
ncbi:MAG: hypothetical protein ACLTDC_03035 [Lachnospiraceae bacterium]